MTRVQPRLRFFFLKKLLSVCKLAALGVTERFPLASRIGTATGQTHSAAHDANAHYEFGLRAILRGIDDLGRTG